MGLIEEVKRIAIWCSRRRKFAHCQKSYTSECKHKFKKQWSL